LSASVYLTPGGFAPNSDHELIALQRTYYLSTTYIWDGTEYGYIADPRINVGEVNTPINSCAFIQDNSQGLRSKLENGLPW
jgi:hypothetical protein